ncbi:hypothetical protein O9929_17990 [Vibrio lentus]|nr:hypothetical protein [Vibrio lentus]
MKDQEKNNIKVLVYALPYLPASGLFKKQQPKWVMSAELVETSQL